MTLSEELRLIADRLSGFEDGQVLRQAADQLETCWCHKSMAEAWREYRAWVRREQEEDPGHE